MRKKGFTLIELLAVIVILAIIALIATPIVLNSIENAQEGAAERTTENYIDAVETKVASTLLNGKKLEGTYTIQTDGNLCPEGTTCDDDTEIKIDMGGKKPNSGTIIIENGQVTNASTIKVGDYTVSYDEEGNIAASKSDGTNTSTTVYRWSEEMISIGDTINPSTYTTDPTTLGKDYYLKHVLDNDNKVTESYACAKVNGKQRCLRGGEDYYTKNKLILQSLQNEGVSCNFYETGSECGNDSVALRAYLEGTVGATDGSFVCGVGSDGLSYCGPYSFD